MGVPIIAAVVAAVGAYVLGFSFGYFFSKAEFEAVNKELLDTCEFALSEMNNMTTDEFSLGKDKPIRERLEQTINRVESR